MNKLITETNIGNLKSNKTWNYEIFSESNWKVIKKERNQN